jgi:hypothetical protein
VLCIKVNNFATVSTFWRYIHGERFRDSIGVGRSVWIFVKAHDLARALQLGMTSDSA